MPQQTIPRQAPSLLFGGPFVRLTDILTALPQDAAYLVQEYSIIADAAYNDEWVGQLVLRVDPPHGSVRINCFYRVADIASGLINVGAFLSYETVRNLLAANIAAGKNVRVDIEPNDYYRQAVTWPDVFERQRRRIAQQQQLVTEAERARFYGTSTFETSAPPVQKGPTPDQKAEALLKSWLSEAQLARYEKKGWFEVVGNVTGQRYRINKGRTSNVELIDAAGEKAGRICVVTKGALIECDLMLAQKVALETDELAALRVANPDGGEGAMFLVALAKYGPKWAKQVKRIAEVIG
jgi:hypothetical protein